MNRHVLIRSEQLGGLVGRQSGAGRVVGRSSAGWCIPAGGRVPRHKGSEPGPASVLMFCVSDGADPMGSEPEDTPNARVAE